MKTLIREHATFSDLGRCHIVHLWLLREAIESDEVSVAVSTCSRGHQVRVREYPVSFSRIPVLSVEKEVSEWLCSLGVILHGDPEEFM